MSNYKPSIDKKVLITFIVILFVIIAIPVVYSNSSKATGPKPVISETAKAAGECVRPKVNMKGEHMQILDGWRNSVVRDAKRVYLNENGKEFEMSLSNSCLRCHDNKEQFCDKCHDYASVKPYCWDCHVDPNVKGGN